MSKRYIHYGSERFVLKRFNDISNRNEIHPVCKPNGGLWASPVDANIGWKYWCEVEHFHTERLEHSFTFTLADDAKILYLNDIVHKNSDKTLTMDSQFKNTIRLFDTTYAYRDKNQKPDLTDYEMYIDFWRLKNLYNYDAIELTMTDFFYWLLYGWDVDSLLVLNPDCVVVQQ